jgi:HEAT repeat protein
MNMQENRQSLLRRAAALLPSKNLAFLLAVATVWSMIESPCGAQDPFGDLDPLAEDSVAAEEAPAATTAADVSVEKETNPAVLAIVESDPQSPRQLVRATELLLNLDRPERVKLFLQQLLAGNPSQQTLADLQREYGSALFLRLSRIRELQPEGAQICGAVLDAANQVNRDPARIARLISQLNDPATEVRWTAIVDLRGAGESAVTALIAALADDAQAKESPGIKAALIQLGQGAVDPLVATIESGNPVLKAHVIEVLGELGSDKAVPYLLVPMLSDRDPGLQRLASNAMRRIVGVMPTKADAVVYLGERIESSLSGDQLGHHDEDKEVTVWEWDAEKQTVLATQSSVTAASLELAARIARQRYLLEEGNVTFQRQYLTILLQSAQTRYGLDRRLPIEADSAVNQVAAIGVDRIEELLAYALGEGHFAAATAAINLLGEVGDLRLLFSSSGAPTVLASSLHHADRRVRFSAAMAIRSLKPEEPYPGCSLYPESLAYFIGTIGTRRALIAHPRIEAAQSIVGMLGDIGIEADTAPTARAAHKLARQHPDYEFILVSDGIDYPPVSEFIQHLRRDPRTALLPIGIMSRESLFSRMQRVVEFDPLADAYPRPHDVAGVAISARRLLVRGAPHRVPYEVRVRHAVQAMEEFSRLANQGQRYGFYDLLRHQVVFEEALSNPNLAESAAEVLGQFGSPGAQRALVGVASQNAADLAIRNAAATAFRMAVDRRGIMLNKSEILRQYDRYNQSAALDRETQQVLGALLDAIEAPSQRRAAAGGGS